jgi:hypothetical protein
MKVNHSRLPILRGDCHHQPCAPNEGAPNEEGVRIPFLVFFGLAVIFVPNVAALAILQISPSEIRVIIASLVLTMLGLFMAIGTRIPRRLSSDTFRIDMALTVGFSVGGMLCMLLSHLIHPAPRPLIFQMISFRKWFTYYVAVFVLLWLLQKCSCVSGIVQKRQTEESDTTEEEFSCGVEYLLLL